jgi:large subunit ribosomal protein L18
LFKQFDRKEARGRRQKRARNKIFGTPQRPRLNVYRSLSNIYAQLIDDQNARTLASASSLDKSLGLEYGGNCQAAEKVGSLLAQRAQQAGITEVVFDRGGNLYHGRVAALSEGARKGGLKF